MPSLRARWMWFAGSTNDIPFETLNGLQLPTVGSKTVSVPEATTTATGAPWTCQPKLPPGATRYDSRIVVPVWAWIVVAWIFPAAIVLATIGASFERRRGRREGGDDRESEQLDLHGCSPFRLPTGCRVAG